MPEMHFTVEWPDGTRATYYSPSYVIEEELTPGTDYALGDFLERVTRALNTASERVRARYGFACSSAMDELAKIGAFAAEAGGHATDPKVRVLGFEKHPPRDARAGTARGGNST
jgi:uncharacterized repeat protein (TIGR04042 family)